MKKIAVVVALDRNGPCSAQLGPPPMPNARTCGRGPTPTATACSPISESMRYVALMRVGNRTMATEGRITQAEFMDACKADVYPCRARPDEGAPLKGANSFTEGQAKDRAIAHGRRQRSDLKKDDDGIWRGTATQDGKTVQIAVDYKGNVVTTAQQ